MILSYLVFGIEYSLKEIESYNSGLFFACDFKDRFVLTQPTNLIVYLNSKIDRPTMMAIPPIESAADSIKDYAKQLGLPVREPYWYIVSYTV